MNSHNVRRTAQVCRTFGALWVSTSVTYLTAHP